MVEVNARDIQAVEKAVKEEIAKDEVSRSLRRQFMCTSGQIKETVISDAYR